MADNSKIAATTEDFIIDNVNLTKNQYNRSDTDPPKHVPIILSRKGPASLRGRPNAKPYSSSTGNPIGG